ncbi:hypothetical protein Sxan_23360 [Streptomyces xanthophaeus]|uniref:Uncharacterized protein n=1 Tax=Streptomyces xanthophaeus TaxID=67385 RepID=A0A919GUP3_9ACTN|nr:hypothetical protein Sxan_23360 [Streptomyces xanthophaeus]
MFRLPESTLLVTRSRASPASGTSVQTAWLRKRVETMLGCYSSAASTPAVGPLRPLRDPEAPKLDDDEDGTGHEVVP